MSDKIKLCETGYGSVHRSVLVLRAKSRALVRKDIKARNWKLADSEDTTGQVYASKCQAMRLLRTDSGEWEAICLRYVYWNV